MFGSAFFGLIILSVVLISSSVGIFKSYGAVANTNSTQIFDDAKLQKLLTGYVNWNVNVPTEELPEEGNNCVIKPGDVNLLLDPFSKGTVSQTCDIKADSSLIFPFYEGWCDSGGGGMYGEKSYDKMLNCALDSDKGVTKMEAWLDGNKIVDNQVVVDLNAPYNMKFAYDKLPQNKYFKVIKTPSFFDLIVTNKTRFATTAYEKPEEFQSSPAKYIAVAHCFCGLLTNITSGPHELRYKTTITGTGGIEKNKGWDQVTDVIYKLNAK